MRISGYLAVAASFVAVALVAFEIIARLDVDHDHLALIMAALVATQVGVVLWHRRSPGSSEREVKLGLALTLLATAVPFMLAFQAVTSRLVFPEIIIPIAAGGCFGFPFAIVGPLWRSLAKARAAKDPAQRT